MADAPLNVTQAMNLAKRALEGVRVRVLGEVSEFKDSAAYKAAYFSLGDGTATMPCLMWRDEFERSGVPLREGMLVEVEGVFSAYIQKGRMQFTVRSLALAGEGRLRQQVAQLAEKLAAEGLMRPERKRPIPAFPARIAVVTSPNGKAIHDVIRTLRRRYPLAEVLVAGVPVEGATAASSIVDGIRAAVAAAPDVILLVRGGGSYEDLMPFNAEEVARAVVASPVPVVSGIGHEPDNSIADMVADLRASTPTAAAESATPDVSELASRVDSARTGLAHGLGVGVERASLRIARLSDRPVFKDPGSILLPLAQRLDGAGSALHRAIPGRFERDAAFLARARERLLAIGTSLHAPFASALGSSAAALEALSPLAVLGRGYAVCFSGDGRTVVRSVQAVDSGDAVSVRVHDGMIACRVQATQEVLNDG